MDRGAWWAAVCGVVKSRTRPSDFTFTFQFHALEKEMATHSSVLAWRIPGMAEPGGLPSMGSHRVGHDWSDLAAAAASSKGNLWVLKVLLMNLNIFDELQFVTVIISDAHIVSYLSVETLFSWLLTLLTSFFLDIWNKMFHFHLMYIRS